MAAGLFIVLGWSAQALELPPVGGISAPGEEGMRFSVFLGVLAGLDSNVLRERPGKEDSDSVTELLGGMAFMSGKGLNKVELRHQLRADSYGDERYDFDESQTLLGVHAAVEKIRFALRAKYASLVEPIDIEITENLERRRISYVPEVDLSFGRMEVGLGYSAGSTEYADALFKRLDREDGALRAELRWRHGEVKNQQVYAHLDLGKTDYTQDVRSDFDYQRLYLGWRSETPHESGIELGVGANMLNDFGADSALSKNVVFALVRFRSSLPAREGRSALELTYARSAEAAATADCKTVSGIQVRYSETPKLRLGWSIGLSSEKADYVNPDPSTSDSLFRFSADAGLQIEIGSPKRTHGRFYLTVGYETRSGDLAADDYSRLRALAGLALVH